MKDFGATGYRHTLDKRLRGHFGGNLEDQNSERSEDSRDLVHQVLKDSLGNRASGLLCFILAKNLASFCLCLNHLSGVELRSVDWLIIWHRNFKTG